MRSESSIDMDSVTIKLAQEATRNGWITNRLKLPDGTVSDQPPNTTIGDPCPTSKYSVDDMKRMGLVGIYRAKEGAA